MQPPFSVKLLSHSLACILLYVAKTLSMVNFFYFFSREVVECEEFLSLTSQQVTKLISSDRLTTPSEEKVHYIAFYYTPSNIQPDKTSEAMCVE